MEKSSSCTRFGKLGKLIMLFFYKYTFSSLTHERNTIEERFVFKVSAEIRQITEEQFQKLTEIEVQSFAFY